MITSFSDQGTEDIYNEEDTKKARKTCPSTLHKIARRKLHLLDAAASLKDLAGPRMELHALKAPREGKHAFMLNDQYRIVFRWTPEGAADVIIEDYHQGPRG